MLYLRQSWKSKSLSAFGIVFPGFDKHGRSRNLPIIADIQRKAAVEDAHGRKYSAFDFYPTISVTRRCYISNYDCPELK